MRTDGNEGDSNPGKSTPALGRRENGAVGEHAVWESHRETANSKLPLGLLPTSTCLFYCQSWFLAQGNTRRILAGV